MLFTSAVLRPSGGASRLSAALFVGLLLVAPATAAAQAPCTTDARRVVDEIYRHMLERAPDPDSAGHVERLVSGDATVRDIVRDVAVSPEHTRRFFPPGQAIREREQAVGTLYRHLLGRQPDPAGARAYAELSVESGVGAVIDAMFASREYQSAFGDDGVPGSGGLRYCGPDRAQLQPAAGNQPETRFGGMDRNSDGVITRGEWQGSPESFRVHDWNRDGVLSADEVRAGASRRDGGLEDQDFDPTRDDDFPAWSEAVFSSLDHNRDGRLALNEWHGTLAAFAALDRNRDNGLSRAEIYGDARSLGDRFAALDFDGNGVLSLDEWHWSRRSFDQRDTNRNDMLTWREFNSLP